MARRSRQNLTIREFILTHIDEHPDTIGALTVKKFGVSRTAVGRYMQRLINEGLVSATGRTNARRYALKNISEYYTEIEIKPGLSENEIWRAHILPQMKNVPANIVDICQYGFTEMFNNVIDHSGSKTALISYKQTYATITMWVVDEGVGIFAKIQKDFNLPDPRTALLELSKGKLTSDKTRHSGEGIFFTSRMFDNYSIQSGNLFYMRERKDDWGWLTDTENRHEYTQGTAVSMVIGTKANWTTKEVFEKFQDDDYRFLKTHIPISLGKYEGEKLVSRSQAKRILARFERFAEVLLDFQGIKEIGQPFADEIFRVFKNEHPGVTIIPLHTSPDIDRMIAHVQAADREQK